jgi:hypothetical protein
MNEYKLVSLKNKHGARIESEMLRRKKRVGTSSGCSWAG